MAFKSRDLMMKLSTAGSLGEGEDTCTKCTDTHEDHGDCTKCTHTRHDGDRDGGNCEDCTMTHPTGQEKRHALADPGLGLLRRQLRETLSGDAR
jgi:hypothetical protein